MKKIVMTMMAMVMAMSMNAQGLYVGGSLGFTSAKQGVDGAKSKSNFRIVPEVGYSFDDTFAAGVAFGYQKGTYNLNDDFQEFQLGDDEGAANTNAHSFTVNPYQRVNLLKGEKVSLFVDCGFGYTNYQYSKTAIDVIDDATGNKIGTVDVKKKANQWEIGVKPGVAVSLSDNLSFVAHCGFLGYKTYKTNAANAKAANAFGVDVDGNNLTFGLYYNF